MSYGKRIKEIRERCVKATRSPWTMRHFQSGTVCVQMFDPEMSCHISGGERPPGVSEKDYAVQRLCNGNFVAHAREDVPWLLEYIDELLGRQDELMDRLQNQCSS